MVSDKGPMLQLLPFSFLPVHGLVVVVVNMYLCMDKLE